MTWDERPRQRARREPFSCRAPDRGADEMRRDAHLALEGLAPLSPYRPPCSAPQERPICPKGDPGRAELYFT